MTQNDQGWPPYVPPQPPAIDEITIGQAHDATNILLDCQGLEFIRFVDNRIAQHINQWEKDIAHRMRARQGIREQ